MNHYKLDIDTIYVGFLIQMATTCKFVSNQGWEYEKQYAVTNSWLPGIAKSVRCANACKYVCMW